jgi:UMF1 family MFS transporter
VFFVVPTSLPEPGRLYGSVPEKLFLGFGLAIGALAGPLQASSRTLLARMAPPGATGRYFGLFALSGKLTSFAAPLLVAITTELTGTQGAAPGVLIVFFTTGALLLRAVPADRTADGRLSAGSAASR